MLPLTSPVLLTAVGLAWARALGEFGATITFAGNFPGVTQTLPIAVYITSQSNFDKSIAVSVILLAVSFGVLATLGVTRAWLLRQVEALTHVGGTVRRDTRDVPHRDGLPVGPGRDDGPARRERLGKEHRAEVPLRAAARRTTARW